MRNVWKTEKNIFIVCYMKQKRYVEIKKAAFMENDKN